MVTTADESLLSAIVKGTSYLSFPTIAKSLLYVINSDLRLLSCVVGIPWIIISVLNSARCKEAAPGMRFRRPASL